MQLRRLVNHAAIMFRRLKLSSSGMDGDFDVLGRSRDGCIPPLLAMARLGGSNAERETMLMEQEVHQQTSTGGVFRRIAHKRALARR